MRKRVSKIVANANKRETKNFNKTQISSKKAATTAISVLK